MEGREGVVSRSKDKDREKSKGRDGRDGRDGREGVVLGDDSHQVVY